MLHLRPRRSFGSWCRLVPLFGLLCSSLLAQAATNTTYDDTSASFTWLPPGKCTLVVNGVCATCSTKLDPTQCFNATYRDCNTVRGTTEVNGGSFSFTGSDVYLYGIDLFNSEPSIVFILQPEGRTTTRYYDSSVNAKFYHSLFYSANGLSDGAHTLSWTLQYNSQTSNGVQSVQLDYAVVTTPDTPTTGNGDSLGSTQNNGNSQSTTVQSGDSNPSHSATNGSIGSNNPTGTGTNPISSTPSGSTSCGTGQQLGDAATSKHSSVGPIVGAVVGTLVALAVVFFLWRRKRRPAQIMRVSKFGIFGMTQVPSTLTRQGLLAAAEAGEIGPSADAAAAVVVSSPPEKSGTANIWPASVSARLWPNGPRILPSNPSPFAAAARTTGSPTSPSDNGRLSRSYSVSPSMRTTSTQRDRERALEARVAELEARMAGVLEVPGPEIAVEEDANGGILPPPYVRVRVSGQNDSGAETL